MSTQEFDIVSSEPRRNGFAEYVDALVHLHSRTLTALGFTLIPLFFILDFFMMPQELLNRFAVYRLVGAADDTITSAESSLLQQIASELDLDREAVNVIRNEFAPKLAAIQAMLHLRSEAT